MFGKTNSVVDNSVVDNSVEDELGIAVDENLPTIDLNVEVDSLDTDSLDTDSLGVGNPLPDFNDSIYKDSGTDSGTIDDILVDDEDDVGFVSSIGQNINAPLLTEYPENTNRGDDDIIFREINKSKSANNNPYVVENYRIVSFNATIIKPVKGMMVDKSININADSFMDIETIPDIQEQLSEGLSNTELTTIGDAPIVGSWGEEKVLFKFVAHFNMRGENETYVNVITGYSDDWDVTSKRLSAVADICFTTSQVLKLDDGGMMIPLSHDRMLSTNELSELRDTHQDVMFVDDFKLSTSILAVDDGFKNKYILPTSATSNVDNSPSFNTLNDFILSKGIADVKHLSSLPSRSKKSVINKIIQKTFWNSLSDDDESDNLFGMPTEDEVIVKIKFKNILKLIEDPSCIQIMDKESFDELLGDLFRDDNNDIKDLIGEGDVFDQNKKLHVFGLKIIEVFKKAMTRAIILEAVIQMRVENGVATINVINFTGMQSEVTRKELAKINRIFKSVATDLDPFLDEMDGLLVHGRLSMNGLTNRLLLEQNGEVKNYESVSIPSFTETVGTSFSTKETLENLDSVVATAVATAQVLSI